jgi:hypothetical protein
MVVVFGVLFLGACGTTSVPGTIRAKLGMEEPFPGSRSPAEVLAHIKATVAEFHLAEDLELPELAKRQNDLRIRRILKVRSEKIPPQYVVAELSGESGTIVARIAFTTTGDYMMAQNCRQCDSLPLDLSDAVGRVQTRRSRAPVGAEYVHFDSHAEPGLSRLRPLAMVITERGSIYFNSRGEAFAEDGADVLTELGGAALAPLKWPPTFKRLHSLGQW